MLVRKMLKKYQKLKKIKVLEDAVDKVNMTIPKGCFALVETTLSNPMTHREELVLLIDNGTGLPETYPKTVIEKDKLKFEEVR